MVVVVVVEVVGVVSRDRYKFRYISIVKIFNLIQTLKLTREEWELSSPMVRC